LSYIFKILAFAFNLVLIIIVLSFYVESSAQNYDDKQFSILVKGCSPFNLSVLEAIFIKSSNLILCRQKEFVYNLTLLSH